MKEEHKEDAKRIGRNILNLIIKNEIEQKDLAVALGVSEATVSSWVNGTRIPRMGTVNKICKRREQVHRLNMDERQAHTSNG